MKSKDTGSPRSPVRWGLVAAFVITGTTMLVGAAVVDAYARDVLVSVGTAFLLFAFLALAERRLIRVVEEAAGPRTLDEAQAQLGRLIGSSRQLERPLESEVVRVEDARDATIRRVIQQLQVANLRQQPLAGGQMMVRMTDEAGLGIVWSIAWNRPGLRHEVTIVRRPERAECRLESAGPRTLGTGHLTRDDQRALAEFEGEVLPLIRQILLTVTSPGGSR